MMSLRRKHRWFGMGFLLAWALSHSAVVKAQNETGRMTSADKIRKTLDSVINLDYEGYSFSEAMGHLRERTQLPVIVDQVALRRLGIVEGQVSVELRGTRTKVRQALQQLLTGFNLTYVILEDTLLITTEEMGIARQMRQRVPVDVADVPVGKALREIARKTGINIVFDPRIGKQMNQPVSLQVEEATVETALRLIAELVDLKAVRMGNVVFVTDPARAERIRREEAIVVEAREAATVNRAMVEGRDPARGIIGAELMVGVAAARR
jgi:hypothetical protein